MSERSRTRSRTRRRLAVHAEPLERRQLLSVALAADAGALSVNISAPTQLTAVDDRLLFLQNDARQGATLWTTDGTAADTRRLAPHLPLTNISGVTRIGELAYFTATLGDSRDDPWVTDGTARGTRQLTDFEPGSASSSPVNGYLALGEGNDAIFFGSRKAGGVAVYASDGTAGGTRQLAFVDGTLVTNLSIQRPVAADGVAYFVLKQPDAHALWRTDGTATGTYRIETLPAAPIAIATTGQHVFYAIGQQLFASDGSAGDAHVIATFGNAPPTGLNHPINGSGLRAVGDRVYFSMYDVATGVELWHADANGASRVADIRANAASSSPTNLTAFGDRLFFTADDGVNGRELWITDGTALGTRMVADLRTGANLASTPGNITVAGDRLWFSATGNAGHGAFVSDGTAAGTSFVPGRDGTFYAEPNSFRAAGDSVFFAANSSIGTEVWRVDADEPSNGSAAPIQDFYRGTIDGDPKVIGTVNGRLIYFAFGGQASGIEPYFTDGTPAGSGKLMEIYAGSQHSFVDTPAAQRGIVFKGHLYFVADDASAGTKLFRTDGTPAGTTFVATIPSGFVTSWVAYDDRLTFFVDRRYQWSTDGTTAGTYSFDRTGTHELLTTHGEFAYFSVAGTTLIRESDDVWQRFFNFPGNPRGLTAVGDELWVFAGPTTDNKLYRFRPTAPNEPEPVTSLIAEVLPGQVDFAAGASIVAAGNRLFFASTNATSGTELYVSDGTAAGTGLVADLLTGAGSSNPRQLTALPDGSIVFRAGAAGSERLWRSDGTAAGTFVIGGDGLRPDAERVAGRSSMLAVDDVIYFTAVANGQSSIWRTDGTAAGTWMVASVGAGPSELRPLGDAIAFTGDDGPSGTEIWTYTPDAPPMTVQSVTVDRDAAFGGALHVSTGRRLLNELAGPAATVVNLDTGAAIAVVAEVDLGSGDLRLSFPLHEAGLPGGRYRLTLPAGSVTDDAYNPLARDHTFTLAIVPGDATGDSTVGFDDLLAVAQHYGQPGTFSQGDFDYSGTVDFDDLLVLAKAYGTTLSTAPAAATVPAAPTTRKRSSAADVVG